MNKETSELASELASVNYYLLMSNEENIGLKEKLRRKEEEMMEMGKELEKMKDAVNSEMVKINEKLVEQKHTEMER